jgi:hypothetical protein
MIVEKDGSLEQMKKLHSKISKKNLFFYKNIKNRKGGPFEKQKIKFFFVIFSKFF